jgi:hypothetical protein
MNKFSKYQLLSVCYFIFFVSLLPGCGSDSRTGRNDGDTNFRFINAVTDANGVDLFLDEKEYQLNVGFLESTGYSDEKSGVHTLQVLTSGTANILVDTLTSFADAADQTLLSFGTKNDPEFLLLRDNNEPSSEQTAKIRVIHTSSLNRRVDAYILTSGTSITNERPALSRFNYRRVSTYIALPAGLYDVTVTGFDNKNVLTSSNSIQLDGESVYTIIVTDSFGPNQPARIVVYRDL